MMVAGDEILKSAFPAGGKIDKSIGNVTLV
jgi:hypothetical protein